MSQNQDKTNIEAIKTGNFICLMQYPAYGKHKDIIKHVNTILYQVKMKEEIML